MRENNRKSIASIKKFPQFTTMNVIDGQAGLVVYSSLILYSLTINNILNIIVLLILAAVSIATLTGENGILTQATNAKEQTEIAEAKEQAQLDIAAWRLEKLEKSKSTELTNDIIKGILTGKDYVGTVGDSSFKTAKNGYEIPYSDLYNISLGETPPPTTPKTVEEAKTAGTVFDTNTEITDSYGNKVTVLEGFKIASDSATDVTGGVVIEDVSHGVTAGSQFVWIPVGTIYMNAERTESKIITLGRYDFASDGTPSAYSRQNAIQTTLAKTGEATDGTNKDVRCNIYDMAGNTWNGPQKPIANRDFLVFIERL